MTYRILITKTAKKDIDGLEPIVKKRLRKRLLYVASLTDIARVAKRLEGDMIGEYRIRIGDHRVLFDIEGRDIIIVRVQHRKDVYRS